MKTEDAYPGLWEAISIEVWQRELMEKAMKPSEDDKNK